MKNQKGFIQIPLLIIIIASVVIASAGVGVVLHRQGKLSFLTADISGTLEQNEETIAVKDEEIKQEELQNGQEPKLEVVPVEEEMAQQEINEDEIVQEEQKLAEEPEPELEIQPVREETAEPELIPEVEEPEIIPEVIEPNNAESEGYDFGENTEDDITIKINELLTASAKEILSADQGESYGIEKEDCHVRLLWEQGYCTPNCKCKIEQGPCNSDYDCENGHCAKYAGERYGQLESIGVCEEVSSTKILAPTENEEWEKGKSYTIKWDYSGPLDVPLSIYLQSLSSSDSSAIGIVSEILGQIGEYHWTVPNSAVAGKFWTLKISGSGIPGDAVDYIKIIGKNIPTVATYNVTDAEIKSDYATLEGTVLSLDGYGYYSREDLTFWFEWGESLSLGQKTIPQHPRGNSWTLLHDRISGLSQNTTYYFRVAIQSDDGVNYGEVKSFTTKSAFPPTVLTLSRCPMQGREFSTDIMADSDGSTAFCGHITDLGGARFFETWFEWGETSSLGQETLHRTNVFLEYDDPAYHGYESRFFGDRVTPESIYDSSSYCFRVAAKNNGGVSYGEMICF